MDLLAHSAGAILATLYAAAYPEHLSRLILITPGLAAVGVDRTEEQFRAALEHLADEPWYPAALAALEKIMAGGPPVAASRASQAACSVRRGHARQTHAHT